MIFKLINKGRKSLDVLTLNTLAEDGVLDSKVSLIQWWNYSEKRGLSIFWIRTNMGIDEDIHGRSLLGLYRNYNNWVIEFMFLTIKLI